jgi:predicted dehydrogenase
MAQGVALCAIVDPTESARDLARSLGVTWFAGMDELIAAGAADGVILATPNTLHAAGARSCIEAGIPVLIEKPVFTDLADGQQVLRLAEARGVPVAAGHHRRHNPLIARARQAIDAGQLGRLVSVQATTWFMKPDDYFEMDWRRRKGAGPVYLNLIHDMDLLMHLCGPIDEIRAIESNAVRGNDVEDTAAILVRFANGALGTVNASDTIVAPLSWELTARENPSYPATAEACYWIGGTHGSLALPNLALWSNPDKRSWWEPISATRLTFGFDDPLVEQARQFGAVVRGDEAPLVSGWDGLAALAAIEAIKASAASGTAVSPSTLLNAARPGMAVQAERS